MPRYLKIIITVLFALAIILGLIRRDDLAFWQNSDDFKPLTENTASGDQSLQGFYQKSQNLTAEQNNTVTFLATGDIMLSRSVASAIAKAKDPLLPFRNVDNLLRSTDFNFGNLESPISGTTEYNPTSGFNFNTPPTYTASLKEYNFKIMNGANNHAFDQGKIGIDYTKAHLWEQGVGLVGTGSDLDEAWQPQVITARNIKIGFLGASYGPRNGYIANIKDKDRLKQAIADLGMRSDFIVVTMHAGAEYTREPHSSQREFAQAAIDYGADLVIGAHPHWIQPIEQYNGKYIFYSLGNFVFDQGWSQDTKEGLALKITLDSPKSSNSLTSSSATIDDLQGTKVKAQLKQIELVPVIIERYCCPRLATETETTAILQKINVTETIIEAE